MSEEPTFLPTPPPGERVATLKVASSQDALSQQLMDELTAVCKAAKYDHIYISTLVGVLEMIKWNYLTQNQEP